MAAGGLVTAIWQGTLLAAAAGLGLRMVPKAPAAVRFTIWFAVFAVVVALPVVAVWPHAAAAAAAGGHGAWLVVDERWSLAIAALWVAASLVRAGTLLAAAVRVRALWRRAEPVAFAGTESEAGSRGAQVCVSDEVDRPSVIGFLAPKILIPRWLLERLTAEELVQIVLHEAGHLGRADDWLNLVQKIALVIFPLNPALAWVERRLCFERELACDERVLRATGAPKAYAACLAALAEHRRTRPGLALSLGALGRESELGQRVGRILRFGEWMRPAQARVVMGVALVGLAGGVAGLQRCPQVVGFSAAMPAAAMPGVAEAAPARAANRFGYQAVVFHADGSVGKQRLAAAHRADGVADMTPRATARRGPAVREVVARAGSVVNGQRDSDQVQPEQGMRLLVVTSWDGSEGSRVVLTTAEGPGEVQQVEQVQRYAAVPVRGGWLVFQL